MDTIESTRKRVGTTLFPFDIPGFAYRQRLRRDLQLIDEHARAIADGVIVPESYCLLQALFREMDRAGLERDPVLAREFPMQLHFAGLTSVASTLVWTLLMIALHPAEAGTLVQELREKVPDRVPTPADVRGLPVLESILSESMRLYPGSAYEFKQTVGTITLGGYELRRGQPILLAPWVTQRSESSFEDPLTFQPERFRNGNSGYAHGAFLPWGTGQRSCIGKQLALNAVHSAVGGITGRYRLDLAPGQHTDAHAGQFGNSLLPRPGVRVIVAERDSDTERSASPVTGTVVGATHGPRRNGR